MEDNWLQFFKEAGIAGVALAATVFIVIKVLKHLREERTATEKAFAARDEVIKTIGDQFERSQYKVADSMAEVRQAYGENKEALNQNTQTLERARHAMIKLSDSIQNGGK